MIVKALLEKLSCTFQTKLRKNSAEELVSYCYPIYQHTGHSLIFLLPKK